MELPAAEVERLWVLRNVFLLLDVQFAYSFIRGLLSEQPISKSNEFIDNLVVALGEKVIPFFSNMLKVEIKYATSTTDFTKTNSVAGKILTSFMQLHMQEYFKKVLANPLAVVCKGNAFESKMGGQEVQSIIDGFTDLIDAIFNSDSQCPVEVKSVLKMLQDLVDASKLRHGLKLVGFFVIERGWCPAISLPKSILPDLEVDPKVYVRLQQLAKLLYDLARQNNEKGPFSHLLGESNTTMIEYLANVCSNTDKGPHAITTNKTPQQILATKAFTDFYPTLSRAVLESSMSKYLNSETDKEQYQHCLDMYNIFRTVASEIGLQSIPIAPSKSLKNLKTVSKKDLQRRESLAKCVKSGDMKEFTAIATSQDGKAMLDFPMDDGSYPLILACANRQPAIVKYLLFTAKVNANVTDLSAMTPFTWACKNGTEDILSYLLAARPSVDVSTCNMEGSTPLHFLTQTLPQHDALFLTVIDRGANVNAANKVGESILALAVKHRCSFNTIQAIINGGADIDYRDAAGRTALYWAEVNDYEQVIKLLAAKGAQPSGATTPRVRPVIHLDTCTCSSTLSVSFGGTCNGCGKTRVREIAADKSGTGFAKPWTPDQVRTELMGRSMEQRCALLGRKPPSCFHVTFHFGEKEFTAKVPTNAVSKYLLRRCQVDTAVSFAWERDVVYGLTFTLPPLAGEEEKREVWVDLENPLWMYDFDEQVHLNVKPVEKEKKPNFYLKFLFAPATEPVVVLVNPYMITRSILTSNLAPYLPPNLSIEAHRLGMHHHLESGTTLLNDQQPVSTLNIMSWDILSVKIRDAYELESIDDPTQTILVEKGLSIARVIDMLSHFLKLGNVPTKVEDLNGPISQELQAAFVDEGIPIPANLLSKENLRESSEMRPRLVSAQTQYFEPQKIRPPQRTNSKNSPQDDRNRFGTWNVTSPSPTLTKSSDLFPPADTEPNGKGSERKIIIPSTPSFSTQATPTLNIGNGPESALSPTASAVPATPTFLAPSNPASPAVPPASPTYVTPGTPTLTLANSSNAPPSPSPQALNTSAPNTPSSTHTPVSPLHTSASSNSFNRKAAVTAAPPLTTSTSNPNIASATDPSMYSKETVRCLSKVVRNVNMMLFEGTPLTTYNLASNDILEIADRVVIYPRDPSQVSDKYTLVLPPVINRLRVKWVAPTAPESLTATPSATTLTPLSTSTTLTKTPTAPFQPPALTHSQSSMTLIPQVPKPDDSGVVPTSYALKSDPKALQANPNDVCTRNEAKLIFLGYSGSGKTSLIRQIQRIRSFNEKDPLRDPNSWNEDKFMKPDICGVVKSEWKLTDTDTKYVFRTHELVGKEEFLFSQQFLISPGCIFILVFNMLQPKDDVMQSWLETIQTRAKDAPVLIVGTHSDAKEAAKKVTVLLDQMARRYCQKYPNIAGFTAVSNKNFKGISKLAQLIVQVSRDKKFIDSKLPVSHAILAKILSLARQEAHRVHCPPYITWEHIKAIGDRMGLWDRKLKDAMQYCMDISGIVYFGMDSSSPLADLVFLDNQWLPALMNSVLRFKPANSEAMVLHSHLCQIWKSPYFPIHIHPVNIELLNRFEVLFAQDEFHYLVPLLLPEERPLAVKDLIPPFEPAGGSQSERIFEFGPVAVGFFSRLVARMLGMFDSMIYWRNGIVVSPHNQEPNSNCRAILEYIPSTYRLRMSVRNDKNGKLVRPLADSIMTFITTWFPGRLRRVLVTCAHCIRSQSYDPFFFDLDECERAAAQGKQYVMCRGVHPVRIDLLALDVTLNDQSTIPYDQLTLQEKLGEGSFAKVYKGKWGGKVVAVKVITMTDESTEIFREFRKEALLMSGLQHPNIVSLRGICLKPLCLVAELLPLGDLHSFLIDPTKPMNWPLRIKIARDIAMGMEFLHCSTPPIVHRDLKSPNILLGWTKDKQVVAKVTDFGLSTRSNAGMVGRQVWNVSWLAPEIMRGHAYSTKVDVYSYGMVLWELFVRQKPFSEYDSRFKFDRQLEEQIEKGLRPTIPADCLPEYTALVKTCWADSPAARPTFTEIIESLAVLERNRVSAGGETTMPAFSTPAQTDTIVEDETAPTSISPSPSTERSTLSETSTTPNALIFLDDTNPSEDDEETTEGDTREKDAKETEDKPSMVLTHKGTAAAAPGTIQCMMSMTSKVGANQVWVGCGDGSIIIIDANTRQKKNEIKHHTSRVCHIICIYRPKQEPMVWTASMDGTIVVLDSTAVNKPVKVIKVEKPVTCLQELGDSVWCGSLEGVIRIYDKTKFKLRKTLKSEGSLAIGCFFSPSEDRVWVGTEKCIWIMDAKTNSVIRECEGHASMISAIELVNGNIWSCSADKTIRVWSMDGEPIRVLQGHSGRVFCLLAVGSYVISGSWDKSLFVWDAKSHTFLHEVAGYHTDSIGSLVMVKDEIWTGSWDKTINIFTLVEDTPR